MFSTLIALITYPINKLVVAPIKYIAVASKRQLVGDLSWKDIRQFEQLKIQAKSLNILGGYSTGVDGFKLKQYGLLGYLLPNMASIVFNKESSDIMKPLITQLDLQANSRAKVFGAFSQVSGCDHFMANSGPHGMAMRKNIVRFFPRTQVVLDTAVSMTQVALSRDLSVMGEGLLKLVRGILSSILLGSGLTEESNQLLDKITPLLLSAATPSATIKQEYKNYLCEVISEALIKAKPSTLLNIIKEKQPELSRNGLRDLSPLEGKALIERLATDSEIAALPTLVITASNVAATIRKVTRIHSTIDDMGRGTHTEITIPAELLAELKRTPLPMYSAETATQYAEQMQQLSSLDALFKAALDIAPLEPRHIMRVTSEPIKFKDKTIPANTVLVLHHRNRVREGYVLDFQRFNKPDDPKLGSAFFAPFSTGVRSCPGSKIAETIFKAVVMTAISTIDVDEISFYQNRQGCFEVPLKLKNQPAVEKTASISAAAP
ncbi:MAG: cytochrome P450 [Legionellales bacterium]